MKKALYAVTAVAISAVLLYYPLVLLFTFVWPAPWGVERYLSMKGLVDVEIQNDWTLIASCNARPSHLIGMFSQYTAIIVRCEEFDAADITGCPRLEVLNVDVSGVLKNIGALRHMSDLHVAATIDEPISDPDLLKIIRERRWCIGLRATPDTMSRVCVCHDADVYLRLDIGLDAFRSVGQCDIERLRKQKFRSINCLPHDWFWEMMDKGIFPCECYYDIHTGKTSRRTGLKDLEILGRQNDPGVMYIEI